MIPVHSLLLNDGARTRSTGIWSDIPSLLSRGLFGLHWDVKKLTFVAIAFVALLLMFFVARSATPVVDLPSGVASLGPLPSPFTFTIRVVFAGASIR